MQNAADHDGSASTEGGIGGPGSIVRDLITPIEHVQGSIAAIEAEIAREQLCSNPENAANVIVLDDVTPRYAKASVALNVCRAGLGTAQHAPRVKLCKAEPRRQQPGQWVSTQSVAELARGPTALRRPSSRHGRTGRPAFSCSCL